MLPRQIGATTTARARIAPATLLHSHHPCGGHAGGTLPRMVAVEPSLEQRPRTTQEAKVEGSPIAASNLMRYLPAVDMTKQDGRYDKLGCGSDNTGRSGQCKNKYPVSAGVFHPVEPNPPSARSDSSKDSTTLNSACTTGTSTICAIRSPGLSVNDEPLRFQHETNSCPW